MQEDNRPPRVVGPVGATLMSVNGMIGAGIFALDDGSNGFLVKPGNAQDLARAMMKFVAEPNLVFDMAARSRTRAERTYDVEIVNRLLLYEMDLLRLSGGPTKPRLSD